MFYSHEILTSRKHGVATVWLVATLGAKSALRKVTRKAILDVDVAKACNTIVGDAAPMALRLQGNLLYGVSRVYSQQCSYVLSDLQTLRDKMRSTTAAFKELGIDPELGRAKADQLNLPDDPAFLPDLDLNFDHSIFDLSTDPLHGSGIFSPFALASSHSGQAPNFFGDDEPAVVFPSADDFSRGIGGFELREDTSSAIGTGASGAHGSIFEESAINQNLDFDVDAEGNVLDLPSMGLVDKESVAPEATGAAGRLESDSGIEARVQAEHDAIANIDEKFQDFNLDDGMVPLGDEDPLPSGVAPSPPGRSDKNTTSDAFRESSSAHPEEEIVETIEVPQRRVKTAKPLMVDRRTELSNRELAAWNTEYLANMAEATRTREKHQAPSLARRNAAFWVLGQGIGGVATAFGGDQIPHPLSVFSGQALLDALAGRESSPAGTKRGRSSGSDDEEEDEDARRVRLRDEHEEQVGRGDEGGVVLYYDDVIVPLGDDMPPSEVGRTAPPSLPDHSSQMPWNMSGSRHGSVRPFGSGLGGVIGSGLPGGISSSIGVLAAGLDLTSSVGRRGSRLTSASPLQGKGSHVPRLSRISSLEIVSKDPLQSEADNNNFDDDGLLPLGGLVDDEEFQLYGPAAAVDTQTAAQSQWIAATLENEAHNFLLFLDKEIQDRHADDDIDEAAVGTITFEELLPPSENNNVVAAQAMLHVLALTTKGLIEVRQDESFGDIIIGVVGGLEEEEAVSSDGLEV